MPLRLSDLHPGKGDDNNAQGNFEVKGYPVWAWYRVSNQYPCAPSWVAEVCCSPYSTFPRFLRAPGPLPIPTTPISCSFMSPCSYTHSVAFSTHSLSSLMLALLDQTRCWPLELQRCLSLGPCSGCHSLDEEMSLYI